MDYHAGQTMLSRVWIRDDLARQLRELARSNDHTVVEEVRCAVREHLKRNRRRLNGTHSEAAPGKGGSGPAARDDSARDVCSG
jgi:hypothetical protein